MSSDAYLVEQLYDKLKAEGLEVWWDKKSVQRGKPGHLSCVNELCVCQIFVPVLSWAALTPCAELVAESACDNMLVEYQMALELQQRGDMRVIAPVFVGEIKCDPNLGNIYSDFFEDGHPQCSDIVVKAVEKKLHQHLNYLGKGTPRLPVSERTVKRTLGKMTEFQGAKLLGMHKDAMDKVIENIVCSVDKIKSTSTSRYACAMLPSISTLNSCTLAQACIRCELKPRLSAFCIGVDAHHNASLSNDIGSGVERAHLLYTKLHDAQFDLSLANSHFRWNPHSTQDLWRRIRDWLKEIESVIRTRMTSTVPEVVLFCFSGPQKEGFLLPTGNVLIDDLDLEIYGMSLVSILKVLLALECKLAPKSLLFVVMIDATTAAPCPLATMYEHQPSRCVIIPTCTPRVADVPSHTSVSPLEIILDKMFEPGYPLGMALKRSFQALEDDGHSGLEPPRNLECIPQNLALRPSVKFSVDQAYLHVTFGHSGTRTDADTVVEELLMDTMELESGQSGFSDRMQRTAWPEVIRTQPPNVVGTLNMYSTSRILQRCEDQIFGVLLRSMIYVPIVQVDTKDEICMMNIQMQKHCNSVLLQHILGIEFVRNKYGAMQRIFPVMVQMPSTGSTSQFTLASAESFLETLPDVVHRPTHEAALVLLDRIGITITKWTVRSIFRELLQEHETPTSIGSKDEHSESIPLARRILKDLETHIEGLKTASFKACVPQGEEVISWLKAIGWGGEGGMATTFARHAVCSLRDITNLPQEHLRKICRAKVSKEYSLPDETQIGELEKYLKGAINELKKSELSKDLQYRLDFFCDMTISVKDILFAHHGLEVMVTKPVSWCALSILGVAALAYHGYSLSYHLPRLVNQVVKGEFGIKQGNEIEIMANSEASVNGSLSSSLHLALFFCMLSNLYFWWHVRSKSPRVVSRNTIFLWRAQVVIAMTNEILWCLYLTLPNHLTWTRNPVQVSTNLSLSAVLLSVLITAPQYFVLCFLSVLGLLCVFSGGRGKDNCGYFDFVCMHIYHSVVFPGKVATLSLGAILVSALVILMFMRYRAARILRRRLQETMKESEFAWQTMISPRRQHCSLFVKACLVSNRDSFENDSELANQISQIAVIVASDFHLASASRATSRHVLRLKMCNMIGKSCIATVSLLVKPNLSLNDLQTSIKSAGFCMHVIEHHRVPPSLASLAMLCERIEDDLMAQRMQATAAQERIWRPFNRTHNHEPVDRYTKDGKRLQREEKIDLLFQQAQLINSLFHDELKKLLHSFGDGSRFEPGPIKTPARALEKVVRRSLDTLLDVYIRIFYVCVFEYVYSRAYACAAYKCTSTT